jgi:hypothetical protein
VEVVRMKIILSRKGFDSSYGGCASPILEDGTLISMPIPESSSLKFSDIKYNNLTYDEIWKQLNPKAYKENACCHLDPDIRSGLRINEVSDWIPAFGQTGAAQSHLENNCVTKGDIFLFFGWFKHTEIKNGVLKYKKGARDLQVIYGYLQIGDILKNNAIEKLYWHPHSNRSREKNNTIYLPTDKLVINGKNTERSGCGVLNYSEDLVLTKSGCSRSKWKLLPWMSKTTITYHTGHSLGVDLENDCFQSAAKGQEFVVYENDEVIEWAKKLITENNVV